MYDRRVCMRLAKQDSCEGSSRRRNACGAPQDGHEPRSTSRAVPAPRLAESSTASGGVSRLFRSHEQAEQVGAIADTRATFEEKGWA
jgi:hypothetical protein